MKWLRFQSGARTGFGTLDADAGTVHVHGGTLFDEPEPSGERLALGEIAWLTPCAPSKIIGLWNNFHALAD